ncbi:MAG: radical SAM protein [Desulfomonile tiedjei]|nr:radical SAM protein [Desulfomonile tiedjei]
MSLVIRRHYQREHYSTVFSPATGFFARIEEPGHSEPFWSKHGPELIDISITNWCDRHCTTCYRSASANGTHLSIADYTMIMEQAASMDTCQVALGGGNPNQHPDFADILKITRERFGIIPNYTTNGRGLTNDVLEATARFCGAVAVSAYMPYEDLSHTLSRLNSFGIKTNIHFVLDRRTIETAIEWLLHRPEWLRGINALIFLNYKPVGRGGDRKRLLSGSTRCSEFMAHALGAQGTFRIGFDSCMVSGFAPSDKVHAVSYEACDAGRFTMYVSETLRAYPCSFMETDYEGIPVTKSNMIEIWRNSALFREIRRRLSQPPCHRCSHLELCKGGCPAFPEINLCAGRNRSPNGQQV